MGESSRHANEVSVAGPRWGELGSVGGCMGVARRGPTWLVLLIKDGRGPAGN